MLEGGKEDLNGEDLTYIRYSAKEILFHLTQKIETVQNDIHLIKIDMVTRQELTQARRWAVGSGIAAIAAVLGSLRFLII